MKCSCSNDIWVVGSAADTLREQELLLLRMADCLSDHRYMSKQMVHEFLEKGFVSRLNFKYINLEINL